MASKFIHGDLVAVYKKGGTEFRKGCVVGFHPKWSDMLAVMTDEPNFGALEWCLMDDLQPYREPISISGWVNVYHFETRSRRAYGPIWPTLETAMQESSGREDLLAICYVSGKEANAPDDTCGNG